MEKSHFSSTFALAFGNRIALTNDPVVVRATDASALPKNQQIFGGPIVRSRVESDRCLRLFSRSLEPCHRSYDRRSLSNVHRTFFTRTHSRSSYLTLVRTIITWGPRKVHVFATSTWQNELLVILTNKKFVL